jgi:signal transduction histidine kinase
LITRRKTLVTYVLAWCVAIGTALRYLSRSRIYPESVPPDVLRALAVLFALFFALLLIEPWLTRRSLRYAHIYLLAQSVIVVAVSVMTPEVDYFATLIMALVIQAMVILPLRIALRWLVGLTALMAILMLYGHPFDQGLPLVIIMAMAYFFIGAYAAVTRDAEVAREEAEAARKKSQDLLVELQAAHEQLQAYAAQAEEMAVTTERNRLARDLHDSVTQSLFSLTLFTQAALERVEVGDLDRAKQSLARIADTARRGLKEMRLLVYELRPLALEGVGLVGALQQRLEMVEGRSGVQTRLLVEPEGDVKLPPNLEEELYRIAQEALNNTLKHANASSVTVRLAVTPSATNGGVGARPDGRHLEFEVSDDGCGFDLQAVGDKGGLGLTSIRERVEGLGGELNVISSPGQGTALRVAVPLSDTEKTL